MGSTAKGVVKPKDPAPQSRGLTAGSPFNALLQACYTIHVSIPYFQQVRQLRL